MKERVKDDGGNKERDKERKRRKMNEGKDRGGMKREKRKQRMKEKEGRKRKIERRTE